MAGKFISRRCFIEKSLTTGLAVGLGLEAKPFHGEANLVAAETNRLALTVSGDRATGFAVILVCDGQPVLRHNQGGEFSAVFQNEERSLEDRIDDWKAGSWTGDASHLTLVGECKLKNLNTTVFARVEYQLINHRVVRKKIQLRQADMFLLFYQLSNRMEPLATPTKLWSFDEFEWRGGALREEFPAAGFRTKSGLCVGLLTDSGYRNKWTRIIRRDGRPLKPAPRRSPDLNLYSGLTPGNSEPQHGFVQQTFGEVTQQTGDQETIRLPEISSWKKLGGATLNQQDDLTVISLQQSDDSVMIPFVVNEPACLSLRLQYRATAPVALQLWKIDEHLQKTSNLTLYNDTVPESGETWCELRTSVFVPGLEDPGNALLISLAPTEQALNAGVPNKVAKIELRGLRLERIATRTEPYHRLEMDRADEKVVFVFADGTVADTVRAHRLASQLCLAEGLGFAGGETEKVLYADLMMLCWIAGPEELRPIVAPSIWYSAAGEMYLRDSFFALTGIHNRELNENVFSLWGENQGADGAINTLVESNFANVERKSNDSTPLWLMWAFLNRRRFGTLLPIDKVRRAAEYCLRTYDGRHDAICRAQFVMGQLDVIRYPEGTSAICENQGMLAVTLRAIKELQIPGVSESLAESHIARAEDIYRSYYDPIRKFMRPAREIADAIGLAEIFPEYLSLWLFHRKILTDEMVVNHLGRIPLMMPSSDCPYPRQGGTVRPILIGLSPDGKGGKYFDERWHPMVSDSFALNYAKHAMDGIYYNGGSWMRVEICGYVTGERHGWKGAKEAIANRLWAELNIARDFPTSQEYLATDPAHPFFGYHRVFAWNSFVFQALEQAGLRHPSMDPDYIANLRKKSDIS